MLQPTAPWISLVPRPYPWTQVFRSRFCLTAKAARQNPEWKAWVWGYPDPTVSWGETIWWTESNFLGLRTLLWQCYLAMFKTFYAKPAQKRYTYSIRFYCCKGSATYIMFLISQSHWSLPLLENKPNKFNFVRQTVSHWEAHTGWAWDYPWMDNTRLLCPIPAHMPLACLPNS